MESSSNAIRSALIYADLFDYPLTRDQLVLFATKAYKNAKDFDASLSKLSSRIVEKDGYFYLKGRDEILSIRKKRKQISKQKLELARILASYLFFIPTVQFIGVSGGVAMENAEEDDDIDFFVITKENALWITRLLILLILQALGRLRKRDARFVRDMICVNMLLDEKSLELDKDTHSLYTAHEVVQLVPLCVRENIHERFLRANDWIYTMLPNARKVIQKPSEVRKKPSSKGFLVEFLTKRPMLQLSKFIQRMYMGKKVKEGTVTETLLAFYPKEYDQRVMKEYEQKINNG